jgi:hypothetical protein
MPTITANTVKSVTEGTRSICEKLLWRLSSISFFYNYFKQPTEVSYTIQYSCIKYLTINLTKGPNKDKNDGVFDEYLI